jgi:hypothetical protein
LEVWKVELLFNDLTNQQDQMNHDSGLIALNNQNKHNDPNELNGAQ